MIFQPRILSVLGFAALVAAGEQGAAGNGPGGWGGGGWGHGGKQGGWGGGNNNGQYPRPTVYLPAPAPAPPVQPITMTVPIVAIPVAAPPQQTFILAPPGPPHPIPCGGPGGWCCPMPYQPLLVNGAWICQTG
jgi:hypothetical protein